MVAYQVFIPCQSEHFLKGGFLTPSHSGPPEPKQSQKHHPYRHAQGCLVQIWVLDTWKMNPPCYLQELGRIKINPLACGASHRIHGE